MMRTDENVDFNNPRGIREKGSIKFEEVPSNEFNGRMFQEDVSAVNGIGNAKYVGVRKRPVKVMQDAEVPILNQLVPFSPHVLAPFHTRTGYTYPPLPDYNPEIPVSDLPTGICFLTISSTNQSKTEKIIINNRIT